MIGTAEVAALGGGQTIGKRLMTLVDKNVTDFWLAERHATRFQSRRNDRVVRARFRVGGAVSSSKGGSL
jgi:hypothetical protein